MKIKLFGCVGVLLGLCAINAAHAELIRGVVVQQTMPNLGKWIIVLQVKVGVRDRQRVKVMPPQRGVKVVLVQMALLIMAVP